MDKQLQKIVDEAIEKYFSPVKESSFRIYNQTLCPKLWNEYQQLDSHVRVNLLRMAYDFYKKTKLVAPILDVWLMGSIANYNWSPASDIDIHIIIDFNQLQMPPETASKVAKSAGAQWNNEHNAIIKGHKVEINIQSVKAKKPYVTGIFSLVKNEWIRKPQLYSPTIDKVLIQSKYSEMKKYLESAIKSGDVEKMKAAKDHLDDFRQHGLDNGGELSVENIVYKILRTKGYIKQFKDTIIATYDSQMSVKETKSKKNNNCAICPTCKHKFDYDKQPEIAMGSIACPKCGKPVNQSAIASQGGYSEIERDEKGKRVWKEQMFPKEFDRHALGSCMSAAEMATKYLLSKGIKNFKIVEGWVAFGDEWDLNKRNNKSISFVEANGNVFSHTWIKFDNGRIFDPTKNQWKQWGYNPNELKIVKVKTDYSPEKYLDLCEWYPSPWQKFKKQTTIRENSNEEVNKMFKELVKEIFDREYSNFYAAMNVATKNILNNSNVKIYGGERPDGRNVVDVYDINCGLCEEWANDVREIYMKKTGNDDVEIIDIGNLTGNADDSLIYPHVFIRFRKLYYDAAHTNGVSNPKELFTKKDVKEGYGCGNPEKDPLHNTTEDGKVERWRVKWNKNTRKSFNLGKEIKEIIDKYLPKNK